jgi:hypothetical protein
MGKKIFSKILEFVAWLTGVFVSLAVAFGMIDGILSIRFIPEGITVVFGWIVVVTTLIGILIGIAKLFNKN